MDLKSLINRIKAIIRSDGLIVLGVKTIKFVLDLLFRYEGYYIYKHICRGLREDDYIPKVQDYSVYFISSNDEADELAKSMPDFRTCSLYSARRLDRGAIACCIFIGREFAHIGWIALDRKAQEMINPYVLPVNFNGSEAYTGGAFTFKKYEHEGLLTYGYYKRLAYLGDKGIRVVWNTVNSGNRAAQAVEAKFSPMLFAEARFIKVFCLKFWKQTPF